MLSSKEYLSDAPDIVGDKVRINHISPMCSGTSKSMVIERKTDGIHAKCFRCGAYGIHREGNKPSICVPKNKPPKIKTYHLPMDLKYSWSDWSTHAMCYLNKFGFTEEDTKPMRIGYSQRIDRLIIPIQNRICKFSGWQGKSFTQNPRYITITEKKEHMYWQHDSNTQGIIVLTEDVLSAMKVKQAHPVLSSIALLGVGINKQALRELSRYNSVLVWLDNDNSQVKKAALEIANQASSFAEVHIIKSKQEAKELEYKDIKDIIYSI